MGPRSQLYKLYAPSLEAEAQHLSKPEVRTRSSSRDCLHSR